MDHVGKEQGSPYRSIPAYRDFAGTEIGGSGSGPLPPVVVVERGRPRPTSRFGAGNDASAASQPASSRSSLAPLPGTASRRPFPAKKREQPLTLRWHQGGDRSKKEGTLWVFILYPLAAKTTRLVDLRQREEEEDEGIGEGVLRSSRGDPYRVAEEVSLFFRETARGEGEKRTALEQRSGGGARGVSLTTKRDDEAIVGYVP
ncbi:hypothetical protein BHE74_00001656 [Ensete ventricosum]|nr:hypothetical protein BHE74_00001656 [Ensete ventricosum]